MRRGHFCWACGRVRPNEQFSGKGHQRHICRACARLGPSELAYLQALRDMNRLLRWGETIPKRHRPAFERFLVHPDARVRDHARETIARSDAARQESRDAAYADQIAVEEWAAGLEREPEPDGALEARDRDDWDIPF